jgi:hypothetical protein
MNICGINVVGSEDYNKLNWENKEEILTKEEKLYD